jgi:hypothetical protein
MIVPPSVFEFRDRAAPHNLSLCHLGGMAYREGVLPVASGHF